MAIEILDLPSYNMVIFHSYVNVYQRVVGFNGDVLIEYIDHRRENDEGFSISRGHGLKHMPIF